MKSISLICILVLSASALFAEWGVNYFKGGLALIVRRALSTLY